MSGELGQPSYTIMSSRQVEEMTLTVEKLGINCSIDSQTVNRQSSMGINATCVNGSQDGILIHEHCPFDYCKPERLDLDLTEPDEQCAFHRSSILCGACQETSGVWNIQM